jgi:PAS domain S-box-containing protein
MIEPDQEVQRAAPRSGRQPPAELLETIVAALEGLDQHVAVFDRDCRYLYVNRKAEEILGKSATELLGRTIAEVFPDAVGNQFCIELRQALDTGEPVRSEHHYTQRDRWYVNRYYPTADGVAVISTDITDRKRAEQALAEERAVAQSAEAQHRALLAGVADAILVLADDGRYIDMNPAATSLLGYSPDEVRQLGANDLIAASPEWIEAESRRTLREGVWRGEMELRRKDGSTVAVEVGATPVLLPTGRVFLLAARDISERRAVERLQRDFLAMISHELRNPLATVKGLAQLMQRRGEYSERATEGIVAQANHLDRLVGDLLDVARFEAGRLELQPERLDLVALAAANVEQTQAQTEAHIVRLEAPDRPLTGEYDRDRLNPVFQNLLSNAIKYASSGEIVVRLAREGSQARVSVADQGPGIPSDETPRLFERFYRSTATADGARGFGIGLYVARTLVEAHGGRIGVASQPGQGSEFYFTLPMSA